MLWCQESHRVDVPSPWWCGPYCPVHCKVPVLQKEPRLQDQAILASRGPQERKGGPWDEAHVSFRAWCEGSGPGTAAAVGTRRMNERLWPPRWRPCSVLGDSRSFTERISAGRSYEPGTVLDSGETSGTSLVSLNGLKSAFGPPKAVLNPGSVLEPQTGL